MTNNTLFERCSVNTNKESDVFVGIQKVGDIYQINFPLGFHVSDTEKLLRKDILLLLNVLEQNIDRRESTVSVGAVGENKETVPVYAYLYLIKDFYERGYYKEKETFYGNAKRGKINWSRTIKNHKPIIQENKPYYLDFTVKKSTVNENELITLIHKFCVYESFEKLGWLFTSFLPRKPKVGLTTKMMLEVVNKKIQNTFNDRNRQLFYRMKDVLRSIGEDARTEFRYGTSHFEYVWEKMIDKAFGIHGKEIYFPKTQWDLKDGKTYKNASLEPDSIMQLNGKIYVLDAKYYKYGQTGIASHLPESTSINKQITYGEYIAEVDKFIKNGDHPIVYNAFIMPFDANGKVFPSDAPIRYIGTARSDWKRGNNKYENIIGVLMDVKYLMKLDQRLGRSEMIRLAELIEENCSA